MLKVKLISEIQLNRVLADIENDEGYRGFSYKDTEGFLTIGIGSRFPITKNERYTINWNGKEPMSIDIARHLLRLRLIATIKDLHFKLEWIEKADSRVQDVLYNMAYQLGVDGVLKFKKTLKFLKFKQYAKASEEMLDSLWAKQTPNRAIRLSERVQWI